MGHCCPILQSDLLGRQRGKTRDARFRVGAAIEPCCQPINIDRCSYREVLQARFRQAPVVALTQPKSAGALGERPFNPCPFVILALQEGTCAYSTPKRFRAAFGDSLKRNIVRSACPPRRSGHVRPLRETCRKVTRPDPTHSSLRRRDSLGGTETTKISVRLSNYSASHFEGSASCVTRPLTERAWLEQIGQVGRVGRIAQPGVARRINLKDFLHGAQEG